MSLTNGSGGDERLLPGERLVSTKPSPRRLVQAAIILNVLLMIVSGLVVWSMP